MSNNDDGFVEATTILVVIAGAIFFIRLCLDIFDEIKRVVNCF